MQNVRVDLPKPLSLTSSSSPRITETEKSCFPLPFELKPSELIFFRLLKCLCHLVSLHVCFLFLFSVRDYNLW